MIIDTAIIAKQPRIMYKTGFVESGLTRNVAKGETVEIVEDAAGMRTASRSPALRDGLGKYVEEGEKLAGVVVAGKGAGVF